MAKVSEYKDGAHIEKRSGKYYIVKGAEILSKSADTIEELLHGEQDEQATTNNSKRPRGNKAPKEVETVTEVDAEAPSEE